MCARARAIYKTLRAPRAPRRPATLDWLACLRAIHATRNSPPCPSIAMSARGRNQAVCTRKGSLAGGGARARRVLPSRGTALNWSGVARRARLRSAKAQARENGQARADQWAGATPRRERQPRVVYICIYRLPRPAAADGDPFCSLSRERLRCSPRVCIFNFAAGFYKTLILAPLLFITPLPRLRARRGVAIASRTRARL